MGGVQHGKHPAPDTSPSLSAWSQQASALLHTHAYLPKTTRYEDTAQQRVPNLGGWEHATKAPGKELDKQLGAPLERDQPLPHSSAATLGACWKIVIINTCRASLVVQWLRIHLPMQGTWVQALVREDPTCRGATKPTHHNY